MKYKIIVAMLMLAILVAGVWSGLKVYKPETQDPAALKANFLKGGDFQVKRANSVFKLSDLSGQVVLLYFGFTSCPDVCPTGLSTIKSALSELGDDADDIKVLFVSVDPANDTDTRLKEYLPFFDSRIIGLSATEAELKTIAEQYGVYYKKVTMSDSTLGYTIEHSANFFLIDKEGALAYVVDHGVNGKTLTKMIQKLN
ncbi:SCO family protein [Alkalimarinus coralli]|uniref:SCO family protein n=1 Tax=Alkalimarinus coralli TaxID=2935863 RepID=UPI00202B3FFD|nr:SCO family protein [Alkalimarinus coralli]